MKHILILCKDPSDLADTEPLYTALLARSHRVTFVVDDSGLLASSAQLPSFAHVFNATQTLEYATSEEVNAVVSTCPSDGLPATKLLVEKLSAHVTFILLADARKTRYMDVARRLPRGRGVLLANDGEISRIGPHKVYVTGLPRFDALVRLPVDERAARRRALRCEETKIKPDTFTVLYAGQHSETARIFHDVATAMRGIQPSTPDRPISRALAAYRWEGLADDELVLWNDVLASQANGAPGVYIIPDICQTHRELSRQEVLRSPRTPTPSANPRLQAATLTDAVLAADLVISSTSSVLLTAVALGVKAISYYAPGFGETAYEKEISGNIERWRFHPEPAGCIRMVKTYKELREAISSAIPQRRITGAIDYPLWPEQVASAQAHWTQGNNTTNCVDAIEQRFSR